MRNSIIRAKENWEMVTVKNSFGFRIKVVQSKTKGMHNGKGL